MVDNRCSNCGAANPINTKFCGNCGKKMEIEIQPVRKIGEEIQPVSEPVHQMFRFLFSKNLIVMGILLGILMILIGAIIPLFRSGPAGSTVYLVGVSLLGIFLIDGGIVNDSMDKYMRLGMIVIAVYMITTVTTHFIQFA